MDEIIISNGNYKENNENINYISVYTKQNGYCFLIQKTDHDENKTYYMNLLKNIGDVFEDGFFNPTKYIEKELTPVLLYNNLINGKLTDEKGIIKTIAYDIGYIIAPLLGFQQYSTKIKYKTIDGTDFKEGYYEELINDEEYIELGLNFLIDVLNGLKTNFMLNNNLIDKLTPDEYTAIKPILEKIENKKLENLKNNLIPKLKDGVKQTQTRKQLANYLENKHGIILRKDTGELYKKDPTGYSFISLDDVIILLSEDLGANIVSNKDVLEAIDSISSRLEPVHNIVKFPNIVYDISKFEIIEPSEPVFSLIECRYNYNPEAKSIILKNFLYTSLARETPEETEKTVQGVLEIVGYLFTSGNYLNVLPILAGVSGGGKSVLTNILTHIFGKDKIADLGLQQMNKDPHGLASLSNKHLNFIRDSEGGFIEDNGNIKKLIGNEDIGVNPKYKPAYIIPKEEVPKTVLIANNIPKFKTKSDLINKIIIVEFLVRFRGTDKENPDLEEDILKDPEEIEWLIYNSIEAFKKINQSKDFKLKLSNEETLKLMDKHTNPVNYLISIVINEHNPEKANEIDKPILTHELNKVLIYLSNIYGVDIELDKKGQIPPRLLLKAIRNEYDLQDGETIQNPETLTNRTRKYETQTIYFKDQTGKTEYFREYPHLIANDKYWDILKQLNK